MTYQSTQYEALPTKEIARRTQSVTRAGSKPVDRFSALSELFHNWESGPKGSKIRPTRFSWRRSMTGLKVVPFRFKSYFLTNESTFLGLKSEWKGIGVSFNSLSNRFFGRNIERDISRARLATWRTLVTLWRTVRARKRTAFPFSY